MTPTALITGASSGIGEAFAMALASRGHDLVLVARRRDRLEELATRVGEKYSVRATVFTADLSETGAGAALAEEVGAAGIDVDLLVNNAGFATFGRFDGEDAERVADEVQVNVAAVVDLTRAFLPAMVSRGSGAVINVSSSAAFQAIPNMAVYAATKAFVLSFSEALAVENRSTGVTVFALCPGATRTEFFDVAKAEPRGNAPMQTAAEVVAVALAALDAPNRSGAVVSGWANRMVTTLSSLAPRSMSATLAGHVMKARN